ncbi:GNAT family N-acetyltransferase [Streptomyces alanosinicus]|uniref:N-acetyltransferase domain-containing protein n=1 Tax=Streptomyces alanosinicus TaxID=68171 RepID=A0A919D454_9ACTN|nr:GNAT family N-acetyltransferase [Streptomyces alanosinicus]GHE04131.1 hypothetical protein GCM10010339_34480 [Streptomyces alanosinicus]
MVSLRSFVLDDASALRRIVSGRTVRFTHGHDMTAEEAAVSVRRFIAHDHEVPRTHWNFAVEQAGEVIGLVKARLAGGTAYLSYLLREDTWGNGYATDAVRKLSRIVFTDGVQRIEAKHHPDNPASGRVLVKAGFVPVREAEPVTVEDGVVLLHPVYELIAP